MLLAYAIPWLWIGSPFALVHTGMALAGFLEQNRPREITPRLDAIYEPRDAKVDRVLNEMQFRALPDEEW